MATDQEILAAGELLNQSFSNLGRSVGQHRLFSEEKKKEAALAEKMQVLGEAYGSAQSNQDERGQVVSYGLSSGLLDADKVMHDWNRTSTEENLKRLVTDPLILSDPRKMEALNKSIDQVGTFNEIQAFAKSKGAAQALNLYKKAADTKPEKTVIPKPIDSSGILASVYNKFKTKNGKINIKKNEIPGFEKNDEGEILIDLSQPFAKQSFEQAIEGKGTENKFLQFFGASSPYTPEQKNSIKQYFYNKFYDTVLSSLKENYPIYSNPALEPYAQAEAAKIYQRFLNMGTVDGIKAVGGKKGSYAFPASPLPASAFNLTSGGSDYYVGASSGAAPINRKSMLDQLKSLGVPEEYYKEAEADLTGNVAAAILKAIKERQ